MRGLRPYFLAMHELSQKSKDKSQKQENKSITSNLIKYFGKIFVILLYRMQFS